MEHQWQLGPAVAVVRGPSADLLPAVQTGTCQLLLGSLVLLFLWQQQQQQQQQPMRSSHKHKLAAKASSGARPVWKQGTVACARVAMFSLLVAVLIAL